MEKSYHICNICSDPFSSKEKLEDHSKTHAKGRMVKCHLCTKTLRDEHTLKCHIKTVHGEKKFNCDKCGKKFPHRGVLNAHMKTHDNILYSCSVCNMTFKDASYFKKHVQSHNGNRPHICKICGKSYLQISHLKVHMSLHTKDKPFKCETCQKSFRLAKSFKEHQNMHQNVKTFKCSHCSYSSCFRKNLNAHMKNHQRKQEQVEADKRIVTEQPKIPSTNNRLPDRQHEDVVDDPPVYIFVNIQQKDGASREQIFAIEDMEMLEPLDMAQELSITTQPEQYSSKLECEDYRPLDLTVVPPAKIQLQLKADSPDASFFNASPGEASSEFNDHGSSEPFNGFSSEESLEYTESSQDYDGPQAGNSSSGIDGRFLDFTVDNSGRRRSVFLAEQLEYEHQGEMRVVDPAEVTG